MSYITDNISKYVKSKGLNLSRVARETDISYQALYTSLYNDERDRSLKDDELVKLCIFLNIDPREFADKGGEKDGFKRT